MIRFLVQCLAIALILLGFLQLPALSDGLNRHSQPCFKADTAFVQAMNVGMEKMMTEMHQPDMTGNADVDFLAMMIPHHAGAVEMARLVLLYGNDPLVRQLAEEIIASQQVEVTAMKARLLVLKKGENLKPDDFPAIHGTRGNFNARSTMKRATIWN
ncbi:hypothetical protein Ple7327_2755 [Pleurocapsa sp. PCC 7327]|uniref:DUF305 domain-containing protein n=1 Tax=Pleurocapsa sp. PCC 7327 TaxID=118163 RepID=UPI00029FC3C2|nr:DUF305 domain-containing protein [Pleurocapsa sp. PCC 7327]AFY78025.1 hypothetical protein Ple7327_2755 [Pleurocapsa sp. PCC 7327]